MQLVPQYLVIPKICISGGCKSEDTIRMSNVSYENDYHFYVSPAVITLKSSKEQPRLSNFFCTLMNFITSIYPQ